MENLEKAMELIEKEKMSIENRRSDEWHLLSMMLSDLGDILSRRKKEIIDKVLSERKVE
jgi:DNA-binding winged helix-turn-helix (wHTH) protein